MQPDPTPDLDEIEACAGLLSAYGAHDSNATMPELLCGAADGARAIREALRLIRQARAEGARAARERDALALSVMAWASAQPRSWSRSRRSPTMQHDTTPGLDELFEPGWLNRCDWCGWPLTSEDVGCAEDNCSMRPRPSNADSPRKVTVRALLRAARERDELLKYRDYAIEDAAVLMRERDELRAEVVRFNKGWERRAEPYDALEDEFEQMGWAWANVSNLLASVRELRSVEEVAGQWMLATKAERARAEKAEADLAESKRLVEKAEARAKELEDARDPLARLWPDGEGNWWCKIGPARREELPPGSDAPMRRAVQLAFHALVGRWAEATFSGWGEPWTDGERRVVRAQKEPKP